MRVEVKPELLRWARERAGLSLEALARPIPQLPIWETGEARPTLKQVERFAKATYTPVGYLFLQEAPLERVPIPDFRTISVDRVTRPSPNLLDTLYICQQRQNWYRDFARSTGETPLPFVGSASVEDDVETTAADIRSALGFDIEARRQMPTWTDALRRFIEQADALGLLVMVSGVVGCDNHRKLDAREFRGFALSDPLAPVVFINGADTKAAQMFTLAHEMAHVWIGESALSDAALASRPTHRVERWCNEVAAELLVPLGMIREEYRPASELGAEVRRLAHRFKVSTLVVLRRVRDAGGLSDDRFADAYDAELTRLRGMPRASGGDFYLTLPARVSRRFARALVTSTLEGQTAFTEAFRMLNIRKMATFRDLGHALQVGS